MHVFILLSNHILPTKAPKLIITHLKKKKKTPQRQVTNYSSWTYRYLNTTNLKFELFIKLALSWTEFTFTPAVLCCQPVFSRDYCFLCKILPPIFVSNNTVCYENTILAMGATFMRQGNSRVIILLRLGIRWACCGFYLRTEKLASDTKSFRFCRCCETQTILLCGWRKTDLK